MSKALASTDFDSIDFEKRLLALKDTQESIQQLSTWCLQHRASHKKVVSSWLNVLKQVKVENRLTLFYLANDVIQYSKRKNYEFVDSWGTTLQRAVTMVRSDERVKNKILRIFKIWEQRGIYNEEFLADLNGLLSVTVAPPKKTTPVKEKPQEKPEKTESAKETVAPVAATESDEFQPTVLSTQIRNCVKLEAETDKSLKVIVKTTIPDVEEIRSSMKDRRHVEDVEKEVDDNVHNVSKFMHNLKSEIRARKLLLTALEQAEGFFHNQRNDVKVVANAYRNFGNRIKSMKKKLDELANTLPSPLPSPDINAPSPEPDADFELPDSQFQNYFSSASNSGFMSYMDGGALPFDINDFRRESPPSGNSAQPIQVINSSNDYALTEFFKTLIPETYISPETTANITNSINYLAQQQQQSQPQLSQSTPQSYNNTPPVYTPQSNYSPISTPTQNYGVGGPPMLPKGMGNFGYNPNMNTGYGAGVGGGGGGGQPTPLLPPPMPPMNLDTTEEYDPAWVEMGNWSSSQESLNFNQIETPISPPHFEQEGLNTDLIEYIDGGNDELGSSMADVDHRQLPAIPPSNKNSLIEGVRKIDVDHRNLISLTGSPSGHSKSAKDAKLGSPWSSTGDVDFRFSANLKGPPPPPQPPQSLLMAKPMDSDLRMLPNNNEMQPKKTPLLHPPPMPPKLPLLLQPPSLLQMEDFTFMGSDNDMRFPVRSQETTSNQYDDKDGTKRNNKKSKSSELTAPGTTDNDSANDQCQQSSHQSKRTNDESVDMDFSDDELLENINKDGSGRNSQKGDDGNESRNRNFNDSFNNNNRNNSRNDDNNRSFDRQSSSNRYDENNGDDDNEEEDYDNGNNNMGGMNFPNAGFNQPPPRLPLLPNPGMMMTPPPPRQPWFNNPNNSGMGLLGNRPGMWDTPPPLLGLNVSAGGGGSDGNQEEEGQFNNSFGNNGGSGYNQNAFQNNSSPFPMQNRRGGGFNNDFRQNTPFRGGGGRGGRFNGGGGGGGNSPYFRGRGGPARGRGSPFRGGNMQQRGGKW